MAVISRSLAAEKGSIMDVSSRNCFLIQDFFEYNQVADWQEFIEKQNKYAKIRGSSHLGRKYNISTERAHQIIAKQKRIYLRTQQRYEPKALVKNPYTPEPWVIPALTKQEHIKRIEELKKTIKVQRTIQKKIIQDKNRMKIKRLEEQEKAQRLKEARAKAPKDASIQFAVGSRNWRMAKFKELNIKGSI